MLSLEVEGSEICINNVSDVSFPTLKKEKYSIMLAVNKCNYSSERRSPFLLTDK